MSDLALYRKYRSQTFTDVVGQSHVVQTLSTALVNGRISHAYLFTGPRGVGKTSVARLLARSLNCTGPADAKPCGKCDNCQIEIGSHLDLIEIDAASNRRIDEVRDLRDKIGLAPALGKYKVYIIDEVHMLTTEAFNALLKTLEEPPSHAVFILATTESHKLPATVVSRTQRFSFKPITQADIEARLKHIAGREKIKIDDAAINLLAQASRGSLRDAISLLDQVASLGGTTKISAQQTQQLLGWSEQETIAQLAAALASGQPGPALGALDGMLEQGAQVTQIISQLTDYWRHIMLKAVRDQLSGAEQTQLQQLGLPRLVSLIEHLGAASKSPWPQLALESLIVKHSRPATATATAPAAKARPAQSAPPPRPTAVATPEPPAPARGQAIDPALWTKALMLVKNRNNSLYALLRSTRVELKDDQAVLSSRFNFHRQRLNENRQIIEQALTKTLGRPYKVVCQLETVQNSPKPTDRSEELVTSALEILGGELVDE